MGKNTASESDERITNKETSDTQTYRLNILVANKRGILAKVSSLISKRGADIEELNYKPASRGSLSSLEMVVSAGKGQLKGILNDARKISDIKAISMDQGD